MRNLFPPRQVAENVLHKVTPIDLLLMDLIFSPHLPYSLIHITAIWSPVTLSEGKYSTWKIGIFIWKSTIHLQRAVIISQLLHYVQTLFSFPTFWKWWDFLFPIATCFFVAEIVLICRTGCLGIEIWNNNMLKSTLLHCSFALRLQNQLTVIWLTLTIHIKSIEFTLNSWYKQPDVVRGNCCAHLFDQAMKYLFELNSLFELKIDDVTHQWSNPLSWKSPPRQHSVFWIACCLIVHYALMYMGFDTSSTHSGSLVACCNPLWLCIVWDGGTVRETICPRLTVCFLSFEIPIMRIILTQLQYTTVHDTKKTKKNSWTVFNVEIFLFLLLSLRRNLLCP